MSTLAFNCFRREKNVDLNKSLKFLDQLISKLLKFLGSLRDVGYFIDLNKCILLQPHEIFNGYDINTQQQPCSVISIKCGVAQDLKNTVFIMDLLLTWIRRLPILHVPINNKTIVKKDEQMYQEKYQVIKERNTVVLLEY